MHAYLDERLRFGRRSCAGHVVSVVNKVILTKVAHVCSGMSLVVIVILLHSWLHVHG